MRRLQAVAGLPPDAFNTGYADLFAARLRQLRPRIAAINYACPGESTTSFRLPCIWKASGHALHNDYTGSQLDAALAFLAAHRGKVSPITLSLNGNDINEFLQSCPPGDLACTDHAARLAAEQKVVRRRPRQYQPSTKGDHDARTTHLLRRPADPRAAGRGGLRRPGTDSPRAQQPRSGRVYRLRRDDGSEVVMVIADSEQILLDAQKAIMATELLPGEDPTLLRGPDRVELYPVLDVHDLNPANQTRT
jgi:hypothetical protein